MDLGNEAWRSCSATAILENDSDPKVESDMPDAHPKVESDMPDVLAAM